MAKKRAKKIYDAEEESLKKRSINGEFKDKENNELMGINAALEQKDNSSEYISEEEETLRVQQEQLLKDQQEVLKQKQLAKELPFLKQQPCVTPEKVKIL